MHEYLPSHPMYRRPVYTMTSENRAKLSTVILLMLRKTLGHDHPQVHAFANQASALTDDRIVSVAEAHGIDTTVFKTRAR